MMGGDNGYPPSPTPTPTCSSPTPVHCTPTPHPSPCAITPGMCSPTPTHPGHAGHPTAGSTHGGTAFTGSNDVGPAAALFLGLALIGSGLLRIASRHRA